MKNLFRGGFCVKINQIRGASYVPRIACRSTVITAVIERAGEIRENRKTKLMRNTQKKTAAQFQDRHTKDKETIAHLNRDTPSIINHIGWSQKAGKGSACSRDREKEREIRKN